MQTRAAGFTEVTGLALVRRVASANVYAISYEEHTPEPWTAARLASSMAGGASHALRSRVQAAAATGAGLRPVNARSPHSEVRAGSARLRAVPPPRAASPRIQLGEPLLPERANDPRYYPGLVEDPPVGWGAPKRWRRWAWYGAGALAVFGAGVLAAGGRSSNRATWNALIEITPADAQVSVDDMALPGSSKTRTISGLIRGDHMLSAAHPGYRPHRQAFKVSEGDQRIVVMLERESEPAEEPTPTETVSPATSSPDGRLLSPNELAKKRRSEARAERLRQNYREHKEMNPASDRTHAVPSSAGSNARSGVLKLNSIPWTQVSVDDRPVGNTPILGLTLPAGRHTIKLSNPQLGVQKTLRIKLKPGEAITKLERLGG